MNRKPHEWLQSQDQVRLRSLASAGSDVELVEVMGMCNRVTEQIPGRCNQSAVLWKSTSQQGLHTTQTSPCLFPSLIGNWRSLSRSLTSTGIVCLTSEVPQYNLLLLLKWDLSFYFLELLSSYHRERFGILHNSNGQGGLPRWLRGKESTCQCRRCRFDPWIGKIPWRRKWQPISILVWRIPWAEEPGGLQSLGSQARSWLSEWVCVCACRHTHTHTIWAG